MFQKSKSKVFKTVEESRNAKREPMLGVTAMIRSEKGTVTEGVVHDVSDGGLGVSGDLTGLQANDKVEVVLVIQGERIGYVGQIRHIDVASQTYGIHFESGPIREERKRETTKECRACKRDYPEEHTFCFRCGQRLVGGSHAHAQPTAAGLLTSVSPACDPTRK